MIVWAWAVVTLFGVVAAMLVLREAWRDYCIAQVAHVSPVAQNDTRGDLIQEMLFTVLMIGAVVISLVVLISIAPLRPYVVHMLVVGHAINVLMAYQRLHTRRENLRLELELAREKERAG